ncbi:hypothetical protein U9M48_043019 [Paspalum notatum var. saurae]|uniref:DDE Tnp4 domain-containing protein n=1 Tax=Paspalum notatum var. saurae TaxID=547442 RepID=A0AAQ3UTS9_PASNO
MALVCIMARLPLATKVHKRNMASRNMMTTIVIIYYYVWLIIRLAYRKRKEDENKEIRNEQLHQLISDSDTPVLVSFRWTEECSTSCVKFLKTLVGTQNMPLEEIVAQFSYTLSQHLKNRTIGNLFYQSIETVSRQFNLCLLAVLKLHHLLHKTPEPIPEDSVDETWKYLKNCLQALDGTHIKVTVPARLKERYRSRKADIVTNVIGVCAPDMQFIYIRSFIYYLAGRVLLMTVVCLEMLFQGQMGCESPKANFVLATHIWCYYLVDAGYTNPYRGQQNHLGGWTAQNPPHSAEEYFNMRHARARNIVERCFGRLKGRWAILTAPSYFPIKTQC